VRSVKISGETYLFSFGTRDLMIKIAEHIYFIEGNNRGSFPFANSMLIRDEQTILFDTGIGIEKLKELKDMVDVVINSHLHPDHMPGNWIFGDKRIMVSEIEFDQCHLKTLARRYVSRELEDNWIEFVKSTTGYRDFQPTDSFYDGEVLVFGEIEVIPVHLPGHTKAHFGFYIPDVDLVFGADIDLTFFGPWYGHRESSIKEFIRSIEDIIRLDPVIYLSGHRKPIFGRWEILEELERYRKVIEERERKILSLVDGSKDVTDLVAVSPIYGKKPYLKDFLDYWEEKMILHHLKELEEKDMVKRNGKWIRLKEV
jgi:glyoxylase-like metal-dependent hydrolase (beta-lactamase superfamily II)